MRARPGGRSTRTPGGSPTALLATLFPPPALRARASRKPGAAASLDRRAGQPFSLHPADQLGERLIGFIRKQAHDFTDVREEIHGVAAGVSAAPGPPCHACLRPFCTCDSGLASLSAGTALTVMAVGLVMHRGCRRVTRVTGSASIQDGKLRHCQFSFNDKHDLSETGPRIDSPRIRQTASCEAPRHPVIVSPISVPRPATNSATDARPSVLVIARPPLLERLESPEQFLGEQGAHLRQV